MRYKFQRQWWSIYEATLMMFSQKGVKTKEVFGMKIDEYCEGGNTSSIDCAVAHFRNSRYPWKINHGFYETFFVLEGTCTIEFENETVTLAKHDFFVIEPERKHTSRAEFADVVINCTPPFDIKNVEFCED